MATTITTLSVHPETAQKVRDHRDERDFPNLDAALEDLLSHYEERDGSDEE